jgi:hypothetical protein
MTRERKEKETFLIGKFLQKTNPELAKAISEQYIYPPSPLNDYELIADLFSKFKPLAHDYNWNSKKLFISIILRLYNPQLYNQPRANLLIRPGLVIAISRAIAMDKGRVSKYIRTALVHETAYEEYKAMVDDALQKLHPNAD